jgi:hypothetical protein
MTYLRFFFDIRLERLGHNIKMGIMEIAIDMCNMKWLRLCPMVRFDASALKFSVYVRAVLLICINKYMIYFFIWLSPLKSKKNRYRKESYEVRREGRTKATK